MEEVREFEVEYDTILGVKDADGHVWDIVLFAGYRLTLDSNGNLETFGDSIPEEERKTRILDLNPGYDLSSPNVFPPFIGDK